MRLRAGKDVPRTAQRRPQWNERLDARATSWYSGCFQRRIGLCLTVETDSDRGKELRKEWTQEKDTIALEGGGARLHS